jgi:BMFP domain-containing protein YqiC
MENNWIKKGDLVKMKGIRSPEMRVYHIDIEVLKNRTKAMYEGLEQNARPIYVTWFDKQDVLHRESFNEKDLIVCKAREIKPFSLKNIYDRYEDTSFDLDFTTKPYNNTVEANNYKHEEDKY